MIFHKNLNSSVMVQGMIYPKHFHHDSRARWGREVVIIYPDQPAALPDKCQPIVSPISFDLVKLLPFGYLT